MPKSKREKQEEAKERQTARDKRTKEQQISLIKSRRGESKKELARLNK
jgi:hypothetical protein